METTKERGTTGAKIHPRQPGTIGARITERRQAMKLTQTQLAVKADVGIYTIYCLEKSVRPYGKISTTLKIAKALDMDLNELMYGYTDAHSKK